MPLAKKILVALATLVIVVLISIFSVYKLIDNETIEKNALEALQNTLKRKVTIDGDFSLTRSLNPTLKTSGVSIESADWDQDAYLLSAEKLEFGVALPDLLRGVITIQNIVFDDAVINIKRNQQGQSNLEFPQDPKQDKTDNKSSNIIALFDVVGVQIKNLIVNYSDQQSDMSYVFTLDSFSLKPKNEDIIEIKASSYFEDQPLSLDSETCRISHLLRGNDCSLSATVETAPFSTSISGTINASDHGNLNLNVNSKAGDITEFLLTKDIALPNTESVTLSTQLSGSFDKLKASNIDAEIAVQDTLIKATGNIASINTLAGVNISLDASGAQPQWLNSYQDVFPAELIDKFTILSTVENEGDSWKMHSLDSSIIIGDSKILSTGEVLSNQDTTQININIDASGEKPIWLNELQQAIAAENISEFSVKTIIRNPEGTINIDDLESRITIEDTVSTASGFISLNEDYQPTLDLSLTSKGKNIQSFEKVISQPLPASNNFSVNSSLKYTGDILTLKDLTLVLDNTQLAGDSDVEFSTPPNVRANLTAESLNLEHLLAATQSSKKENQEKEQTDRLFSDEKINLDWLQSADTDISLLIKNLVYKKATLQDIKANAVAKNNTATIDIDSLRYLDANLRTSVSIDGNKNVYSHTLFTEDFNLGQLLNDIDASETLQGRIDASIDINSYGTSSQELANNASGKITAIMTEGSLADAPIDLLASNLLVELMPGKSKKSNTKVECLFVQLSGADGVFNSDATLLNTENIVMTTNGSVSLTKEELNLLLIPKPKNIELFTLDANIRVAGDLQDPRFSLDKGSVFKKLLKSAATIALGPAALAVPFANMGNKSEKCFSEVASATTRAVEAEQEAQRIAAEKLAEEEAEKAKQEALIKEATVEPINP